MSEAAWNKAFTHGSRELQNRLKKVHAKNPKFQAWMKASGHGSGESVKQASKEVKPTARVKTLQAKSLQAYGATKGVKVGGEHGGEEMRDTIKPLTRDQHSKIQAAERAAKAAAKTAAPKTPKVKKPLTQDERMAAIRRAFTRAKAKDRFDVPTVNPDDADHDDLRDVHQSLHVSRGYNEEVEQIDELKLSDVLKATHGKSPEEKQKIIKAMREKERASKPSAPQMPKPVEKDIPMHMRVYPPDMKYHGDSVELEGPVMNEVTKKEAEAVLGGPTREKPKGPAGKHPLGYRLARSAARKAMRGAVGAVHKSMEKTMAKEEVEQVVEQDDSMEKKEMAQTQLHFIKYAAEEILAFIDMGGEVEEWYQNKLSKVQSEVESLHSYIEGEKRRTGMVEETEQVDEKAPPGAKYERMVKHIKKGYAKGGLTPQEKSIAYATAWKAYGKKEEVEQIDERNMENKAKKNVAVQKIGLSTYVHGKDVGVNKYDHKPAFGRDPAGFKITGRSVMKDPKVKSSQVTALKKANEEVEQIDEVGDTAKGRAALGSYIKKKHDQYHKNRMIAKTQKQVDWLQKDANKNLARAEKRLDAVKSEEVVTEAEGTVAVTPKQKALAAHHGDPKKITYGDVIKARLKSAAAKKMGK